MTSKKQIIKITSNLAFLVIFIGLFATFSSVDSFLATLKMLDIKYGALGLLSLALTYLLRTHRFYRLMPNHAIHWTTVFKVMLQHNAINNVLPFRLGELSFPLLMKKHGHIPLSESAKVLVTARLYDLFIMGLVCGLILVFLLSEIQMPVTTIAIVITSGLLILIISLLLASKINNRFMLFIFQYLSYLKDNFYSALITSMLIWIFKIIGLTLLLAPMLNTKLIYALLGVIVVEGTAILPINGPANFGSLEGAVVAALSPFNLSPDMVFSAVLNLHLAIIMLAAVGYVISFLLPNKNNPT